jgi:hypothetical protein
MARLVVRRVDRGEAHRLLSGVARFGALTAVQWDALWENHGLVAFAAEEGGSLRAVALAESHPQVLHLSHLVGHLDACRLLLDRLVLLAGERDMSGAVPTHLTQVQALLQERGFVRVWQQDLRGWPVYVYRRERGSLEGEGL